VRLWKGLNEQAKASRSRSSSAKRQAHTLYYYILIFIREYIGRCIYKHVQAGKQARKRGGGLTENAGHEIAGRENDGPNCRVLNCRT